MAIYADYTCIYYSVIASFAAEAKSFVSNDYFQWSPGVHCLCSSYGESTEWLYDLFVNWSTRPYLLMDLVATNRYFSFSQRPYRYVRTADVQKLIRFSWTVITFVPLISNKSFPTVIYLGTYTFHATDLSLHMRCLKWCVWFVFKLRNIIISIYMTRSFSL